MVDAQQVHLGGGSTQVSAEATGAEIRCTGPGAPHDPQAAADNSSLPASGGFRWVRQGDRRWAPSPHFPGPACPRVQCLLCPPQWDWGLCPGLWGVWPCWPLRSSRLPHGGLCGGWGDENSSKSSPNCVDEGIRMLPEGLFCSPHFQICCCCCCLMGVGVGGLAGGLEAEGATGLPLRPGRTWLLTSTSQGSYFRPCKASSSVFLSVSGYEAAPPVKIFRIAFYTLASQIFKKFCLEPQKGHTAHAHMNVVRKPLRSLITDYDFWLPDYCTLDRKWLVLASL